MHHVATPSNAVDATALKIVGAAPYHLALESLGSAGVASKLIQKVRLLQVAAIRVIVLVTVDTVRVVPIYVWCLSTVLLIHTELVAAFLLRCRVLLSIN